MVLVTGTTVSGKTTTLYASLSKVNSVEKNIITVEDPVEYRLPGIRQIEINPKVNLTFATGLRSILRQDPDIIMVGEIRDTETAEIAFQAALTGHLVFSTLHTNDAPSSITRILDMGTEPFLISSAIIGILAQRLIRTICTNCKVDYSPSKDELELMDLNLDEKISFKKGKGCSECMQTGYKGRIGIYELMAMDDHLHDLIVSKASANEIRQNSMERGMLTLKYDGLQKVKQGITTVEEVLRVSNANLYLQSS